MLQKSCSNLYEKFQEYKWETFHWQIMSIDIWTGSGGCYVCEYGSTFEIDCNVHKPQKLFLLHVFMELFLCSNECRNPYKTDL